MGEVQPLCVSPRGMLFHTSEASSQKFRQSSEAVVSFFKKVGRTFRPQEPLLKDSKDMLWFALSWVPSCFFNMVCVHLAEVYLKHSAAAILIPFCSIYGIHIAMMHYMLYWYRDTPFRLIGAKARFMVEVISLTTATMLHNLLEYNLVYIILLVGCTVYVYIFAHFLHIAYDIGFMDVLLGSAMPVLVYLVNGELLVRALAASFCLVLSICRFITYSAPEIPAHRKKELKRLPC